MNVKNRFRQLRRTIAKGTATRVNFRRGELFLSYLIWYSIGRGFIEGLRTDSLMLTSHLRMAQVISIVLVLAAAAILIFRRKTGQAKAHYQDLSN
jgi:phosphatidylglycerol:prolipoprotein diacylglycerol transferase